MSACKGPFSIQYLNYYYYSVYIYLGQFTTFRSTIYRYSVDLKSLNLSKNGTGFSAVNELSTFITLPSNQ